MDFGFSLGEIIADQNTPPPHKLVETAILKETVQRILGTLPDRERKIIEAHFGMNGDPGLTLDQIGERFGCTGENIRQIEARAFRRLRQSELREWRE